MVWVGKEYSNMKSYPILIKLEKYNVAITIQML